MRIAVCMKPVVEPESRIELDEAGDVLRDRFRYELNEYDLYAVEEAIRLAEDQPDGEVEVTLVSVGPEDAVQGLRKGLAMGAHDAIHVHAERELGDPAASAAVLAEALGTLEPKPELVLAGVESDDLGGSQVGVLLAESLGYACATMTIATELTGPDQIKVRRELEAGSYVEVAVRLPAVLTIQTGINEPRYPSLKGIMAAKRKELSSRGIAEFAADAARVQTVSLEYPPPRERAQMLEGSAEEVATELIKVLREQEKVL